MSFLEAIRAITRKYFVFYGRARRAEFWWWIVFAAIAAAALVWFRAISSAETAYPLLQNARTPITLLAVAALGIPTLAAMVRRLHDVGWSGRWLIIPGLSVLVASYLKNRGEHLARRATFLAERAEEEGEEFVRGDYWFDAFSKAETLTAKLQALPISIQVLLAFALVSALVVVVLLVLRSQPAPNKHDAPPPQRSVDRTSAWAMIAPFLIGLIIFNVYVFALGFRMSFTDAQGFDPDVNFIGLRNYKDILYADPLVYKDFYRAIKVTFLYTIGGLVTQVPVAFVLAYVLNTIPFFRIRAVLRAAFFLPCLINTVTIALLFRMFFNRDQGIFNHVLGSLGLPSHTDWLLHSQWAIPLMIAVSFWQWTGFHMVYFLAQLQTIDPTLYEAAKMDGISPSGQLRHITLPLMRPAFTFVMVTSAIGGLQTFDLVFILFPNATFGPGGVAKTLVAFIFDQGWQQDQLIGLASAIGWLTFIIIAAVSALQIRFLGLGKHGEA